MALVHLLDSIARWIDVLWDLRITAAVVCTGLCRFANGTASGSSNGRKHWWDRDLYYWEDFLLLRLYISQLALGCLHSKVLGCLHSKVFCKDL